MNNIISFLKYFLLNEASKFESVKSIRSRMRGFNKFNLKNNKINIPLEIKKELTKHKIQSILKESAIILNFFFGKSQKDKEIILRQFLLIRFGYFNFNRSLFFSKGTKKELFSHPIPKDWYPVLEKKGIKVNKLKCSIVFLSNQIIHFIVGTFSLFQILFSNFNILNTSYKLPYSSFYNISSENCLPSNSINGKLNYSLIDWYINISTIENLKISKIIHNKKILKEFSYKEKKIEFKKNLFPGLSIFASFSFILHSVALIFFSLCSIFLGKWYFPLLLKDAILRVYVKHCKKDFLPKQYLFDNSNFVYRPLWTYEAEKKGSEIVCYFFSTNCREIECDSKDSSIGWGYGAMNWPIYYVWDNYQKKFVEEMSKYKKKIITCGPIFFLDKEITLSKQKKKIITVFDILPRRESVIRSRIEPIYYYNKNTVCKFLEDIVDLSEKLNFHIYLKQKRKQNLEVHPKYRKLINDISKYENITLIDNNVSPIRLILNSNLSLSIPFTSSSLYAKKFDKKTAYYDSQNIIDKSNIAAHGLNIICGKNELESWIKENL